MRNVPPGMPTMSASGPRSYPRPTPPSSVRRLRNDIHVSCAVRVSYVVRVSNVVRDGLSLFWRPDLSRFHLFFGKSLQQELRLALVSHAFEHHVVATKFSL